MPGAALRALVFLVLLTQRAVDRSIGALLEVSDRLGSLLLSWGVESDDADLIREAEAKVRKALVEAGMLQPEASVPAWIPCPACDDFWCTIHREHAHDCRCPHQTDWPDGIDPYLAGGRPGSFDTKRRDALSRCAVGLAILASAAFFARPS